MGGVCCKPEDDDLADSTFGSTRVKSWKRHKWRSEEPITEEELKRKRQVFWETEPHYGGDRVIWEALKAACEADLGTARIILDSAGVIVAAADMSICYDERGSKYELPQYVLCDPVNLTEEGQEGGAAAKNSGGGQVELPARAAGAGGGSSSSQGEVGAAAGGGGAAGMPDDVPLRQVAVR